MVYIFMADGVEEIEAVTPADILRRAGIEVMLIGVTGKTITGAHGIKIECDAEIGAVNMEKGRGYILPGGMPGTTNLFESEKLKEIIKSAANSGRIIGAICAAPMILGELGILNGLRATCFPGFEGHLKGAVLCGDSVCAEENIITAKSAAAAFEFSFALVSALAGEGKAKEIRAGMRFE